MKRGKDASLIKSAASESEATRRATQDCGYEKGNALGEANANAMCCISYWWRRKIGGREAAKTAHAENQNAHCCCQAFLIITIETRDGMA